MSWIAIVLRIARFFWDIRNTGYYEINTPFVFAPTQTEFAFRTVIYLDADLYNFVPDNAKLPNEHSDFAAFYEAAFQTHIQKIHDFIAGINAGTMFWGNVLAVPLLVLFNMNFFHDIYLWLLHGDKPQIIADLYALWESGDVTPNLLSAATNTLTLGTAFLLRKQLAALFGKLVLKLGIRFARKRLFD